MTPPPRPAPAPEPTGCGCGTVALAALTALAAGFVLLGSLDHGTTRVYDGGAPGYGTIAGEGAGRWAAGTFLCAWAALGALGLAAWVAADGRPRAAAIPAALAALPFGLAALLAGRHLTRLLAERDRERDYALDIAAGLPLVTGAAAAGAILALLLAGLLALQSR